MPTVTPDSLEAALAKVPATHICASAGDKFAFGTHCRDEKDPAALAAAAREWFRKWMPVSMVNTDNSHDCGYRDALVDVAIRLGL